MLKMVGSIGWLFVSLWLFSGFSVTHGWRVAVEATVLCNGKRYYGARVSLMERDMLWDDELDSDTSNYVGEFLLFGAQSEMIMIEPYLKIEHKCPGRGKKSKSPCGGTIVMNFPKKYIGSGTWKPKHIELSKNRRNTPAAHCPPPKPSTNSTKSPAKERMLKSNKIDCGFSVTFGWRVAVEATVLCNGKRYKGARVSIMERDTLFDDELGWDWSNYVGQFWLIGAESEFGEIEPYLKIEHKCPGKGGKKSKSPCGGTMVIDFPKKFIGSGTWKPKPIELSKNKRNTPAAHCPPPKPSTNSTKSPAKELTTYFNSDPWWIIAHSWFFMLTSLFMNFFAAFLVYRHSNMNIGSYRYILIAFLLFNVHFCLVNSVTDVRPRMASHSLILIGALDILDEGVSLVLIYTTVFGFCGAVLLTTSQVIHQGLIFFG
ncbi:unnamed protein product, partial [Mesorhabditis spiculigera]